VRDFAESHAQISAESRNSEGSASRLLDGGWIAALLHSEGLRGGPAAEPDLGEKDSRLAPIRNRTPTEMPKNRVFRGERDRGVASVILLQSVVSA